MEHLAAKAIKQSVVRSRWVRPDHIYSKLWTAVWVALELFYANGDYIVYSNHVVKVPVTARHLMLRTKPTATCQTSAGQSITDTYSVGVWGTFCNS